MNEILKKLRIVRRTDLSKYDFPSENYPKIYGLYHIYCVNNWRNLVKEQLISLKDSGLLDRTQSLFVSCNYFKAQDIDDLEKILFENTCNAKIIVKNEQRVGVWGGRFEFPALEFIHTLSKEEDFLVYYFHTKGVSYCRKKFNTEEQFLYVQKCTRAYRKMLEYFLFEKYNVAVNVMKEYDTYGSNFFDIMTHSHRYYSGNFWWSKSSYIRTLPQPICEGEENRYLAEKWICSKAEKIFNTIGPSKIIHNIEVPRFVYDKDEKYNWKTVVTFWIKEYFYMFNKLFEEILKKDE